MFVARPGMIMLSLAPKCMSLAPMTSPPFVIEATVDGAAEAGDPRPVDRDLAVDAQARDAAVGKDVEPHVRPRPTVDDREEVVAVAAERRLGHER